MFYLHYTPHSVFDRGIFVPYNTQLEAEMQAARDLLGGDPDFIEGIYEADALVVPKFGWTAEQLAKTVDPPYHSPDKRKTVMSISELVKLAPKHQKVMLEAQKRSIEEHYSNLHQRMQDIKAGVPGNAYVVMTGGTATAGPSALAAATAKTLCMITGSTVNAPSVTEIGVSFDGVTPTAVPVLVELVSGTATTTGTVTTQTAKQLRGVVSAAQTTCQYNATAEPTTQLVNRKWLLTPNGGLFPLQFPLGREPTGQVTAIDGRTWSIRCTAPAIVNVHAHIEFEE